MPKLPAPDLTPEADIALDDWCESKSRQVGRRVEALSAFYRKTQKAGVGRGTASQFEAEFQAFLKLPA